MKSVALYDPKRATFCLVSAVSSDRARCFVSPLFFVSDRTNNWCASQLSLAVLGQDALPSSRCSPTNGRRIVTYRVKFTTVPSPQTR